MIEQATGWEKIFTNHIYNKSLLSRIHKNSHKPTVKTNKTQERHPLSIAKKHKYYNEISLCTYQNGLNKSSDRTKHRRSYRETGSLIFYWWKCKMVQPLWKQFGYFFQN